MLVYTSGLDSGLGVPEEPRVRLHRNAKTTPHMRALLVHRISQAGWEPREAAEAAGISDGPPRNG